MLFTLRRLLVALAALIVWRCLPLPIAAQDAPPPEAQSPTFKPEEIEQLVAPIAGVMTFLVNHDGVVFQKDLGPGTAKIAAAMKTFNPDSTWQRVASSDESPET